MEEEKDIIIDAEAMDAEVAAAGAESPQAESPQSGGAERAGRHRRRAALKSIADAGDEVPYAWRSPLVVLDKRKFKMTRVLRTIKQGDLERSQYLPARSEE